MAAALLLALQMPAGIAAQELTEEELIRRIESLQAEHDAARSARDARLAALRAEEAQPTRVDTVQVGPVRIVTLPGETEAARELFAEVMRETFPGTDASRSLRRHLFTFQWSLRLRQLDVIPDEGDQVVRLDLNRAWARTPDDAKAVIRSSIARALLAVDFPHGSPMRGWLTSTQYPPEMDAYRILVLTNAGATQDCLAGSAAACGASLGFGFAGSGDELQRWYTVAQRREIVGRVALEERLTDRAEQDDLVVRSCIEDVAAEACDSLLRDLDWVTWVPVSDRLRTHAFWYAVRRGGDGAWERAMERAEAPVADVLSYASGMPIEAFLEAWRGAVIESRPQRAGLGGRGTRVLLWSTIFAMLAMRSTRWRLA